MKEFEIAILVKVRQKGFDQGDAFNRAIHNLNIGPDSSNYRGHMPSLHTPFEHTTLSMHWMTPIMLMAKEIK